MTPKLPISGVQNLIAVGSGKGGVHARLSSLAGHVGEPVRPGLFGRSIDRVLNVHDEHTSSTHSSADAIHIGYDLTRHGYLGGLSRRHKPVLQVDHDVSGTRWVNVVEHVQGIAPFQDAVDGSLRYCNLMHSHLRRWVVIIT